MALINIKGYSLNNERNAVYKQLDKPLATLTTDYLPLTGNFRDSIDIVNPELYIDFTGIDCPYYKINYIVIDSFNRRYFVEKVEFVSNKLFKFYLKEDVLFLLQSSNITNAKVFVDRNETYFNPLLEDDLVNFRFNKKVSYVNYDEIYDTRSDLVKFDPSITNPAYVWAYSGVGNTISSNVDRTDADFPYPAISTQVTGATKTNNYQVLYDEAGYRWVSELLIQQETARTFTKGLYVLPFADLPFKNLGDLSKSGQSHLYVGTYTIESWGMDYITVKNVITRIKVCEFTYSVEDSFLKHEPYTMYEIWLPYYGYAPIDSVKLINKLIEIYYIINFDNGESQVQVLSDNNLVFSARCHLLITLPITATNLQAIKAQQNEIAISTIGSVISGALAIATLNPVGVATGIGTIAGGVINNVVRSQSLIPRGEQKLMSSTDGLNSQQFVSIRITEQVPIGYNENYFSKYGRPLKNNMRLIDLKGTGFTKIDKVEFDYISSTATNKVNVLTEELDELESVLKKGIIYNTPNN